MKKQYITLCLLFLSLSQFNAQELGRFEFTGTGACPNQNPNVTVQPSGADFSMFSSTGTVCTVTNNVYNASGWSPGSTVDLTKYYEFTITATGGNMLNLDSLNFASRISSNTANWHLRSSVDSYAADLFSGASTNVMDTSRNLLPSQFDNLSTVTFRFYVSDVTDDQRAWRIDDVILKGTAGQGAGLQSLSNEFLNLYPNPGKELLTVSFSEQKNIQEIRLTDQFGKVLQSSNAFGQTDVVFETASLSSGIYFVVCQTTAGLVTQKWIKY